MIKITERQIQEKLQQTLPLKKSYLFIFGVTLDSPRIELINGSDRINAGLDIILNVQLGSENKPLCGSVDVSGGVRYVSNDGGFYLTDPVVEQLTIRGLPKEYTQRATKVIETVLTEYYSMHPVYKLKAGDIKQVATKLVLRKVIIENQELVVTLGM